MSDCIFCKIIKKESPAKIIEENEKILVFKSIQPAAEIHYLIVPKQHIPSIKDIKKTDKKLIGELVYIAKEIARKQGFTGYKLIFNVGKEGGQVIFHIHLHLLAKKLSEKWQKNL